MNEKDIALSEQVTRTAKLLFSARLRSFKNGGEGEAWRKRLLGLVKSRPGITEKKLVELLSRHMPAGEELLLGLEKKGYLTFKPADGSGDRVVELTEAGRSEAASYPDLSEALGVLSDEEKAAMSGYLSRINDHLKETAGEDGADPEDGWFPDFRGMGGLAGLARMRKLHKQFGAFRGGCGHFREDGGLHGAFGGFLWDEEF